MRPYLRAFVRVMLVAGLIAAARWALPVYKYVKTPAQLDPVSAYYLAQHDAEAAEIAHHADPHDSNALEEPIIREFFADRDGGFFLDVGANHFKTGNNTYYLETKLGWSGIAIDALDEFKPNWEKNRPRTKFFTAFVSDQPDAQETIYVADDARAVSSSNRAFTEDEEGQKGHTTPRKVPTTTLDQLLSREKVGHVDFMSMDIELAEPKALAGFDIDQYRPALVCIEAHQSVRQQILDYFARHHYVLVGKYLHADAMNLYFKPLD